jgi:hypothetical protein
MGSVAEDKHAQATRFVGKARRSRGKDKRYDDAVRELIKLCADDIAEGLREGGGALALNTPQHTAGIIRELSYTSALRVIDTAQKRRPANLPRYARACAAEVARETRAAQEARLRELKAEEIFTVALDLGRPGAASLLDRISFDQRNALVELILDNLAQKGLTASSGLNLSLDREPSDYLLWLVWYIFNLHVEEAAAQGFLSADKKIPTELIIDLGGELGPQPKNKQGQPINLAGPVLVKAFDVLTGLPNNRIPAPAKSNARLGRTFGVDPDVIARWKRHPEWEELHVDIKLNGKGGVDITCDSEARIRSARIVMGLKRGPKGKALREKPS